MLMRAAAALLITLIVGKLVQVSASRASVTSRTIHAEKRRAPPLPLRLIRAER